MGFMALSILEEQSPTAELAATSGKHPSSPFSGIVQNLHVHCPPDIVRSETPISLKGYCQPKNNVSLCWINEATISLQPSLIVGEVRSNRVNDRLSVNFCHAEW